MDGVKTKVSKLEQALKAQLNMARYMFHMELKTRLQREVDNIRMTAYIAGQIYSAEMAKFDAMIELAATDEKVNERVAEMELGLK